MGRDLLNLPAGSLSHMGIILSSIYKDTPENSRVYLIDIDETFRSEIALHIGLPSATYCDFLSRRLGAKSFSQPKSVEQLLKIFLTITKLSSPSILTLHKNRLNYNALNSYFIETDDQETLCLFLDDGRDIGITTAFWNCRWISSYNKILLPKDSFLENIRTHALLIIEFMPHIRAIYVTTPLARGEALDLHAYLRSAFLEAGREILVKVTYQDFRFNWVPGALYSGETTDFTRVITPEGCVRFEPDTPIGHENSGFTFGYDAEVKFVSGRQFFNPKTLVGSHLLTNELWRLEYLDSNKDNFGELWLNRGLPVRAGNKGIAGVSSPGKECSFFIHSDKDVITWQLKEAGFKVQSNEHTRYAQGLVKRLGGIKKVENLISDGGIDIISVLAADGAEHGGLNKSKIVSALITKRGFTHKEAQTIIQQKLKPLLASDLLRRGYCYECPNCNLKAWLSLEEIKEFIECKGCAEREQLPLDDFKFTYKPNELAAQLIRQGGLAVLMTATTLLRLPSSSASFIQFGGDFLNLENNTKFAEVDLFWLAEEALIISECKSVFVKDQSNEKEVEDEIQEKIDRIRISLRKNLDIAELVGASVLILGVFTNLSDISRILSTVTDMVEIAEAKKIGLHLVLNETIHLWGSLDGIDPRGISLDCLLVEETFSGEWSVGESPNNYGGTVGSNGLFDEEVLKKWESELRR